MENVSYSRHSFINNGLSLSYLDFGGQGRPLVALHGHHGCATMWVGLAEVLGDEWRVFALDQRGHGWTGPVEDYSREAYIADTAAFIRHLDAGPVVVLGHSLGGVNAYQTAARFPELIRGMVIEDIGADTRSIKVFAPDWPMRFPSVRAVMEILEKSEFGCDPYFLESLVQHPDGWGFRFDIAGLARSQELVLGDRWADWLGSSCPTLLVNGRRSRILVGEQAREMALRRANTHLVQIECCGHTLHDQAPEEFYRVVKDFLTDTLLIHSH